MLFFGSSWELSNAERCPASPRQGEKALLNDFWYFSSLKSTIREKFLYDTYLSEFFSLVRKERKGQKEEGIPLLNTFCRLAATGANKVPRPSRYSIPRLQVRNAQAPTRIHCCAMSGYGDPRGSKFGRKSGCTHSEIGFIWIIPSSYLLESRPPIFFQRACRQCVHESARLSRVICSHAWYG